MAAKTKPATFGDRLRAVLAARGITVYRLAQLTGITQSHVYRLVSGEQQPSLDVAGRIADALGVTVDELRHSAGS